jgi:hypothetical protein
MRDQSSGPRRVPDIGGRGGAEEERVEAERGRVVSEHHREQSELVRRYEELGRQAAEDARAQAEDARLCAEEARVHLARCRAAADEQALILAEMRTSLERLEQRERKLGKANY